MAGRQFSWFYGQVGHISAAFPARWNLHNPGCSAFSLCIECSPLHRYAPKGTVLCMMHKFWHTVWESLAPTTTVIITTNMQHKTHTHTPLTEVLGMHTVSFIHKDGRRKLWMNWPLPPDKTWGLYECNLRNIIESISSVLALSLHQHTQALVPNQLFSPFNLLFSGLGLHLKSIALVLRDSPTRQNIHNEMSPAFQFEQRM